MYIYPHTNNGDTTMAAKKKMPPAFLANLKGKGKEDMPMKKGSKKMPPKKK